MYHISIYFDEKTTVRMHKLIEKVAQATGNKYMLEVKVPPHITLCAMECVDEAALRERLESLVWEKGTLQWVSIGAFLPGVIFLQPVLNEYLQGLAQQIYNCVKDIEGVEVRSCYRPFSWLPHSTIGKKLTAEQMRMAFKVLQKEFTVFEGKVVRIGLAKMNPHREIASRKLY